MSVDSVDSVWRSRLPVDITVEQPGRLMPAEAVTVEWTMQMVSEQASLQCCRAAWGNSASGSCGCAYNNYHDTWG
jgi:hypothetical protein